MPSTLDNSSPKGLFALFKSEQGTGKSRRESLIVTGKLADEQGEDGI